MYSSLHRNAKLTYLEKTAGITAGISKRLQTLETLVRGGVGLFDANGEVGRTDWHRYISSLKLEQDQPGILGVGCSAWMTQREMKLN